MPNTPIIIWDIDDVLNCLMVSWLNHWNQNHDSNINLIDIKKNPPHRVLGVTKDYYFNSLDEFRNSEDGKNVQENFSVKTWFEKNGDRFKHIACTARPIETMPNQAWWIFHNYGRWIKTVHAASPIRDIKKDFQISSKADFISWIGTDAIFIDDIEENINTVSKIGVDTILYPQPWNSSKHSEEEFITKLNEKLGL